jgi:hypothetical protein
MPVAPGTRLGPYEILAPLGTGGMGEVYRARDGKLDRTVAVKVLPPHMTEDREALARFEREAKAVAALSNPGILAIFDFGSQEGVAYAAMELLDGETLRARLISGPLSPRKAVDYGLQICQALAAAHEKGIVHRDLKPDNVFLTLEGRVKVLDFGLAKLARPKAPPGHDPGRGETLDLTPMTEPGTVMGTVGYMSPEQVRGEETDHRSDVFSFGSILYAMLSGRRAFKGDSAVETMSAILKSEPPDLVESNRSLNPAFERIVRHCLEKRPGERFQSARDLAFQLEALSGTSSTGGSGVGYPTGVGRRRLRPMLVPLGFLVILAAGFLAGRRSVVPKTPTFQQITFRRGSVSAARFGPDGETVVYSAAWEGAPVEVLTTRLESPESRSLGLASAGVFAVSSSGEMAIALGCEFFWGGCHGTLSRVPLEGGSPREMLNDVHEADWTPDGRELAVVRDAEGRHRLELPLGHVLYDTAGWISSARVSPRGDLVAFIDHPSTTDDGGSIAVVDRSGKLKTLSPGWSSAWGLAWQPAGREVWFTAAQRGRVQSLWAVTLGGDARVVLRAPARLILHDVSPTGRVLLAHENARTGLRCLAPGQSKERDLSWFDGSTATDLSRDGRQLLFCERGGGTRAAPTAYLRDTDGSPATNLGEGRPLALSPDGSRAVTVKTGPPESLVLLPTGAGEQDLRRRELLPERRPAGDPGQRARTRAPLLRAGPRGRPAPRRVARGGERGLRRQSGLARRQAVGPAGSRREGDRPARGGRRVAPDRGPRAGRRSPRLVPGRPEPLRLVPRAAPRPNRARRSRHREEPGLEGAAPAGRRGDRGDLHRQPDPGRQVVRLHLRPPQRRALSRRGARLSGSRELAAGRGIEARWQSLEKGGVEHRGAVRAKAPAQST